MRKSKLYSAPQMEVRKSFIRASILAGSNGAFNGVTKGDAAAPPSMSIEGARKRVNFEM